MASEPVNPTAQTSGQKAPENQGDKFSSAANRMLAAMGSSVGGTPGSAFDAWQALNPDRPKDGSSPFFQGSFNNEPWTTYVPQPQPPEDAGLLKGIAQWGRNLAHQLANSVKKGTMTVEEASAKLMDRLYKRLGLPANTQDTIQKMQKDVGRLGETVVDQFKNMPAETFDKLWEAQNVPGTRNLGDTETGFRGDANTSLILQLRLAGKLPKAVEGLDPTGNVRVGLPLATANTETTGHTGKNDAIRLNITGEWGVGASNSQVGLSGGREVNFAITVFRDGTVRLDAVTVNEIVDISVAKTAAKIMSMFETLVGEGDAIEMLETGGELIPDYSTETDVDGDLFYNAEDTLWSDARSVLPGGGTLFPDYSTETNEFGEPYFDAEDEEWFDALDTVGEVVGVDSGAGLFSSSPIKVAETAFSITWVNKDLGDPDAKPRGGWHHDGVKPDSMGVAVKYFTGRKVQVGPDEANLQGRFFGMASAGFGYAFTEAGAKTFGRAIGEWGS